MFTVGQYFTRGWILTLLFFIFIEQRSSQAQSRYYATILLSSDGDVVNPSFASDGNPETYTQLTAKSAFLGFIGKTGMVEVAFDSDVPANTDVYVVLSQPTGQPLLKSLMGGSLGDALRELELLVLGNPTALVEFRSSSGILRQSKVVVVGISSDVYYADDGTIYLKIRTDYSIRRVRVHWSNPALLGVGSVTVNLNVHDVFTLQSPVPACEQIISTKIEAVGINATVISENGEPIQNPYAAIDADESTYATLGYIPATFTDIGRTMIQEVYFSELSNVGEQALIVFDKMEGPVTREFLGDISITIYNNADLVYSSNLSSLIDSADFLLMTTLLDGSGQPMRVNIPVSAQFNKLVISYVQAKRDGILTQPLLLYSINKTSPIPHLATSHFKSCGGRIGNLAVTSIDSNLTYRWYDESLNLRYEGSSIEHIFPPVGAHERFFVQAVNTCGVGSAWTSCWVSGLALPISPPITPSSF